MILVDTNIVARSTQNGHIHQRVALDVITHLRIARQEYLAVVPQVLIEFYAIATRPKESNGLGFTPDQAIQQMATIKDDFVVYEESPDIFAFWEQLVNKYRPRNRMVYDLRLVAAMLANNMTQILTFNDQDFVGYREIQVLNPFDVLGIPRV
jgi:predicted nucleic acid-binding protein